MLPPVSGLRVGLGSNNAIEEEERQRAVPAKGCSVSYAGAVGPSGLPLANRYADGSECAHGSIVKRKVYHLRSGHSGRLSGGGACCLTTKKRCRVDVSDDVEVVPQEKKAKTVELTRDHRIAAQLSNPVVAQKMSSWVDDFCERMSVWADDLDKYNKQVTDKHLLFPLWDYKEEVDACVRTFRRVIGEWPEGVDVPELVVDLACLDFNRSTFCKMLHKMPLNDAWVCSESFQFVYKLVCMRKHLEALTRGESPPRFRLHFDSMFGTVLRTYQTTQRCGSYKAQEKKGKAFLVTSFNQPPFNENRFMGNDPDESAFRISRSGQSLRKSIAVNPKFSHLGKEWDGKLFHGSPKGCWAHEVKKINGYGLCYQPAGFYVGLDPLQQPYFYAIKQFMWSNIGYLLYGYTDVPPVYIVEVRASDKQKWMTDRDVFEARNNSGGIALLGRRLPGVKVTKVYELAPRMQAALYQIYGVTF